MYGIMGVPEVWRYRRRSSCSGPAADGTYADAPTSLSLPPLTPATCCRSWLCRDCADEIAIVRNSALGFVRSSRRRCDADHAVTTEPPCPIPSTRPASNAPTKPPSPPSSRNASRRLLGRRTLHLRPVHRRRRQRPGPRAESDRRARLVHAADRRRPRLAGGASERRRRLGRYGQELQQHLDHHALPGRVPPHRRRRPLRRLLCAEPTPGWHERYGKTPAELAEAVRARYGKDRTFSVPILTTCALAGLVDVERSAVAAVRAGLLPAVVVSLPAAAGRQLRPAGPHRHRPGGLSPSAAVEPDRAAGSAAGDRARACACWRRSSRPAAAFSKRRR